MNHFGESTGAYFSQLEVSAEASPQTSLSPQEEQAALLRDLLSAQDRTNALLEELVGKMATAQKHRENELNRWRDRHPALAAACRDAAEALSRVQIEYLDRMTEEINDSSQDMIETEFLLGEFVDRYGPRLAHLNGVIHVLAQLSSVPESAGSES